MFRSLGIHKLVLQQLLGEYKCSSLLLAPYFTSVSPPYFTSVSQLLENFNHVDFKYMPKQIN